MIAVNIAVVDANDNAPVFIGVPYLTEISEVSENTTIRQCMSSELHRIKQRTTAAIAMSS